MSARQALVRGEMKICEHHLTTPNVLPFRLDRLFHLHDHLAVAPHRRGIGSDLRTDLCVQVVRETAPKTGSNLDDDTVATGDELLRACGNERDAVFVGFDFLGNADFHGRNRSSCVSGDAEHCKLTSIVFVFNRMDNGPTSRRSVPDPD